MNIVIVGASRGIGKALVEQLAQNSSNKILALSRNIKSMETFNQFPNVKFAAFDLKATNVKEQAETTF